MMEPIQDVTSQTKIQPENYSIPVMHNRIKNNQVTALHLMAAILLTVLGGITWMAPPQTSWIQPENLSILGLLFCLSGLVIILITLGFNKKIIQSRPGNLGLRVFEMLALTAIIIYALNQKWYMPLAYSSAALIAIAFAFFWEKSANRNFRVRLTEKGIFLPRFIVNKLLLWQNIQNVIFKYNLVTIDCRDNKIYQFPIQPGQFTDTAHAASFCRDKIEANKSLYREDW